MQLNLALGNYLHASLTLPLATILTCKLNLALGNDGGCPGLVGHQTQLTEVSTLADLVHLNTRKWK
jgi:hypothetical protein